MKQIQKLVLVGYLLLSSSILNAQEWINTEGPEGGTILEMVENSGKLYGRTATNVYVSSDYGSTWELLGSESLKNMTPSSLTSTSFGVHFTATTDKIVSVFDGSTIETTAEGIGQFEIPGKLTAVKDTLYTVAGANLYKSVDGAKTWAVAGTVGYGDSVFGVDDLIFSASLTAGLKVSRDGGATFEAFGPTLSFELIASIVQLGDEYVFATNQGVWAKNTEGEWEKTFNKTGSFTNLASVDGTLYGLNGSVSIVDGAIVGSANIYASADTGKTWVEVEVVSEIKPIYGDHNKVVEVGGKLYATAIQKSNPLVSSDGGVNWSSLNSEGLKNPDLRGIFPIGEDIYITTNNGVGTGQYGYGAYKSSDKGATWNHVPIALPAAHNGSFYTVRKNGNDLYACSYAGLFRSTDGGENWTIIDGTESWYISDIHFTENLWIMAGGDGFSRVWTSSDSGTTWMEHYKGIGAVFEQIHEGESGIVIGSNTTLIASSQDQGDTWHFANADSGLSLFAGGYYDVTSLGSTMYSLPVNEEKIYTSENGGKTWAKTSDLVGLTGVSYDRLFANNGELYIFGTRTTFEGGALKYLKEVYKSTDGTTFEKVIDVQGAPEGFGNPIMAFLGDEFYLGFRGAPVFKYTSDNTGTSTEEEGFGKENFSLSQNYPNPFNPTTNIRFTLQQAGDVSLKVFNMLGQEVATLINGRVGSGLQTVQFDASDLASGVYLYRLQAGNKVQTNKMLLIK